MTEATTGRGPVPGPSARPVRHRAPRPASGIAGLLPTSSPRGWRSTASPSTARARCSTRCGAATSAASTSPDAARRAARRARASPSDSTRPSSDRGPPDRRRPDREGPPPPVGRAADRVGADALSRPREARRERHTLCISSQAGCAVGCPFCATGELGMERDLETAEIVDQVRHAARRAGRRRPAPDQRGVHGHGRAAAQPRPCARGDRCAQRPGPARARGPPHHRVHVRGRARDPPPDRARAAVHARDLASTPPATRCGMSWCRSTGAGRSRRSSTRPGSTRRRPGDGSPTRPR